MNMPKDVLNRRVIVIDSPESTFDPVKVRSFVVCGDWQGGVDVDRCSVASLELPDCLNHNHAVKMLASGEHKFGEGTKLSKKDVRILLDAVDDNGILST